MRLAFLGTGAAFSPERYNGAVVVDGRLLLDGGAPLLPHMHRCGVDPGAIEAVFLTHFHGDHTLGLPPFVLHRVFVDRRPITFIGPSGVEQHLEKLWEVSWGPDWNRVMRPQFKVKYVTARSSGTVAGGVDGVVSYGARIGLGGLRARRGGNPILLIALDVVGGYGGWLLGVIVFGAMRG